MAREVVYRAAFSTPGCKVVVDVGTGRGQSIGLMCHLLDMMKTEGRPMAVLLIDPDRESLASVRVPSRVPVLALESITEVERSLRSVAGTGTRLLTLPCRLNDLVRHEGLVSFMRGLGTVVTCCFSCSYVSDDMRLLSRMGVGVIGVGYLYDKVGEDGVLMDIEGIKMAIDSKDRATAIVDWPSSRGGSVMYREPFKKGHVTLL